VWLAYSSSGPQSKLGEARTSGINAEKSRIQERVRCEVEGGEKGRVNLRSGEIKVEAVQRFAITGRSRPINRRTTGSIILNQDSISGTHELRKKNFASLLLIVLLPSKFQEVWRFVGPLPAA